MWFLNVTDLPYFCLEWYPMRRNFVFIYGSFLLR